MNLPARVIALSWPICASVFQQDALMPWKTAQAQAVLDVFEGGSPDVANAHVDITRTYTNAYVEKAKPVTLD
jgi:hypothetical protein